MRLHPVPASLAAVSLAASLVAAVPAPARACGGFFCSLVPIEQTGERIVFGVEPGKVTAHIQINYQGEAEDFGWVVPVSAVPSFEVGPLSLFLQLDQFTRPTWQLQWEIEGEDQSCGQWAWPEAAADGAGGGESGVEIVFEEEVGPYNVKVLDAKDAQALLTWLEDNGFDQAPGSLPLIEHYLQIDMLFAAVKLKRDAEVGEIQPLVLEIPSDTPCVPLVLTRIAAQPDMPIFVWVLGEGRAVPTNWFEVAINEAKIDWFSNGQNYAEVAGAAIDEAAGHGFVTEFAGAVPAGFQVFYGEFDLAALAEVHDPAQFLDAMFMQPFPRDPQVQNLIRKHIPMPVEATEDCDEENEYYNWNKEKCIAEQAPPGFVFDPAAFVADLEERIVKPLEAAQAMVDAHPYLTRLYSTVSDFEMTRDPMFHFAKDLPDVSNQHTAKATGKCGEDNTVVDVTVTLEDGRELFFEGPITPSWYGGWWDGGPAPAAETGFVDPVPAEGASEEIVFHTQGSPPEVISVSDVVTRDAAIAQTDTTHVPISAEEPIEVPETTSTTTTKKGGGSGGCAGAPGLPADALLALLLLLAFGAFRRSMV